MNKRIRLHPEHGLNPTITNCYFCNKAKDILLLGAAYDGKAPHSIGVANLEPCNECAELMKQGIMLISVADNEEAELDKANKEKRIPNPYRTGCVSVVKEDFIRQRVQPTELAEQIIQKRFCFVPDSAWDAIGLPRENVDNR